MTDALRIALAHLQNSEPEPALEALLQAWIETKRHPAIADAIDLLSATLTEKEMPIRAVGSTSAKAAWEDAAMSKRAAVMGRLLEAIPGSVDRYRQLDLLVKMAPDPRMGTAAKRWLEERPARAATRSPFYGRVVNLIEHASDVRLVPLLEAITRPSNRNTAMRLYSTHTWEPLVEVSGKLARKRIPELDREDTNTLAAIAKLVRAPAPKPAAATTADDEELFATVHAEPDNDEARAVLADLLQQRGDPRGEFIAMQLARHGTEQRAKPAERKLEQAWGRKWLGPLEPVLQKQGVVFERGFLARARYLGAAAGDQTAGAREWSTVTHLDVSAAGQFVTGSAKVLLADSARQLRHVTGLNPQADLVPLMEAERRLPWSTVGWLMAHWVQSRALASGPGVVFEDARKLLLRARNEDTFTVGSDDLLAILEHWPNITELEVDAEPDLVLGLRADPIGRYLKRLLLDGPMGVLTLEGDRLDFETRFCNDDVTNLLAGMVRMLDVKHVTLRGAKKPLVKGDYFFQEYMRMNLAPLRAAAEAAGAGITIEGE